MKKFFLTLIALLTTAVSASAMTYEQARNEALFLTDKMAYELNLSDAQYEAAYEINLDYLMSVTGQHDVFGFQWERRNKDLSYILYNWQWEAFCAASYFYRPLYWNAGFWHFGIYARYPHRDYFFFGRPGFYASYRGAHSWRMNGGRSFYERRHDHFRPEIGGRDQHFGMRNRWDRGDYRNHAHGSSSTRFTAGNGHQDNHLGRGNDSHYGHNPGQGSWRDSRQNDRNNGHGGGSYNGTHDRGNSHGNDNRDAGSGSYGTRNGGGSYGTRNSGGSSYGTRNSGGSLPSGSRGGNNGSYSGSHSGSTHSGSTHSGGFSSGSGRSGGSFSGGHSGGATRSGGSSDASRSGSSRR